MPLNHNSSNNEKSSDEDIFLKGNRMYQQDESEYA